MATIFALLSDGINGDSRAELRDGLLQLQAITTPRVRQKLWHFRAMFVRNLTRPFNHFHCVSIPLSLINQWLLHPFVAYIRAGFCVDDSSGAQRCRPKTGSRHSASPRSKRKATPARETTCASATTRQRRTRPLWQRLRRRERREQGFR